MTLRQIEAILPARTQAEGAGVTVHRTVGSAALSVLDPFLLLDEFVIAGDAKGAGFPDHPHRGFETVTYMLSGRIEHADNKGRGGVIGPGAAQWMTAGRGIVHSEMPASEGEEIRGLQLWVNLAAADKMKAPQYRDVAAGDIPAVALPGGGAVRVIAGGFRGSRGPVSGIELDPLYLDLSLGAGEPVEVPLAADHSAFVYVLEGGLVLGEAPVPARHLAILGPGENVAIVGGQGGARAILVAARALGEPVARYGPFVMSSNAEIEQVIRDFRAGRF